MSQRERVTTDYWFRRTSSLISSWNLNRSFGWTLAKFPSIVAPRMETRHSKPLWWTAELLTSETFVPLCYLALKRPHLNLSFCLFFLRCTFYSNWAVAARLVMLFLFGKTATLLSSNCSSGPVWQILWSESVSTGLFFPPWTTFVRLWHKLRTKDSQQLPALIQLFTWCLTGTFL